MANAGNPISSKRRLLMGATHPVLFYGVEVWVDVKEVYRKAFRVAIAYRIALEPALVVITVALLAKELKLKQSTVARAKIEDR